MSRLRRLLLLAAAVVLAAALAWPRARLTPPAEPYGPAPGATDATGDGTPPGPTGGAGDVAPRTEERTPPERALAALDPKDAWR
ncbi:MAG: hypothetical protein FJ148_09675, partial [Deltaproteobacteria bacterium]|nr:hypothetical protein [Deltaproteobacteria bacterium]